MSQNTENKPSINVTPLIDILLVLLIIFMVVSPAKQSRFETKIPNEPDNTENIKSNDKTLIVTVNSDSSLKLNTESNLGTTSEPQILIARLNEILLARAQNGVLDADKLASTVFLKAPKSAAYGEIAKVVDAIKTSGAKPIALQIDGLQ